MTIEEIKALKEKTEAAIFKEVSEFNKATGLEIKSVDILFVNGIVTSGFEKFDSVKVHVPINL